MKRRTLKYEIIINGSSKFYTEKKSFKLILTLAAIEVDSEYLTRLTDTRLLWILFEKKKGHNI